MQRGLLKKGNPTRKRGTNLDVSTQVRPSLTLRVTRWHPRKNGINCVDKTDANDKSPGREIATQHVALIPISTSNMLWSNFATRTFVGRIKTGTVMRIRSRLANKLLAVIIVGGLKLLFLTLRRRIDLHTPESTPYEDDAHGRFTYCVWHDELLLSMFAKRHKIVAAITSKHQDGTYMANILELVNVTPIRGSSSKGGVEALRTAMKVAQERHIVITPDGPRGPRHELKDGIVFLASKTGNAIVPLSFECSRCWRIPGKWTDLVIPKPFAKLTVIYGEPIEIPKRLRRDGLNKYTQRVQNAMDFMSGEEPKVLDFESEDPDQCASKAA
jgi:lysophospholipid acyltransferase (LPLAT)-like uncharacterized protein